MSVYCHFILQIKDNSDYLDYEPPPFLIFLNPALGPLWQITRQKVLSVLQDIEYYDFASC